MICSTCKHCRPCKGLVGFKWKWFYICDVFAREDDGFAMVVNGNDTCEMWEGK